MRNNSTIPPSDHFTGPLNNNFPDIKFKLYKKKIALCIQIYSRLLNIERMSRQCECTVHISPYSPCVCGLFMFSVMTFRTMLVTGLHSQQTEGGPHSTLHTERTEGRWGDNGKFSFLERLGVLVQSQARGAVSKFAGLVINTNLCAELLRQGGWQRIRMFIFQYDHNPPS